MAKKTFKNIIVMVLIFFTSIKTFAITSTLLLSSLSYSTNLSARDMDINFVAPVEYQEEIAEYESVWRENKDKIIELMESYSKLEFNEKNNKIKVILVDGPSHSGAPYRSPMRMRYNYSHDVKLATLIHELGHRLIIDITREHRRIDSHNILFLFLYDVWLDLKGEDFANLMVKIEQSRSERYLKIWNQILILSKEERRQKLLNYL